MIPDPTARFVPPNYAEVMTLTRESSGFFDDLTTTFANLLNYLFTADTLRSGRPPAMGPQFHFRFNVNTTARVYTIYPMQLLWAVSQDQWIDELPIYVDVEMEAATRGELAAEGHQRIVRRIVEGPFLRYFEAARDTLVAAVGDQPENWPEPWNFARVLRNAFAHGGIHFSNPRVTPVRWRSIEFGPADHGTDPLFPPIGLGDLVDLYVELDHAL
jgi:hypothetical protein